MGADLCGYIMCGPSKISPKRIACLRKKLIPLAGAAQVVIDENERRGKEGLDDLDVDTLPKFLKDKLVEYGDALWGGLDSGQVSDALAVIADAPRLLNTFISDVWKSQYRDQMSRTMPGKKDWVIIVCGERTWGDGPDEDSAWGITERAVALGFFEALGIQ